MIDSIERVARDPLRKLSPDERLIGLLRKLEKHNLSIKPVCRTIAATLFYKDYSNDESVRMQKKITEEGYASIFTDVCGLNREEQAYKICLEEFNSISNYQKQLIN